VTNLWYWNKHNKRRTIVVKWGKRRDSKFLKIEVVMEKDEFRIISTEVTVISPNLLQIL
jgi:hypothetical protein